MKTKSVILCGGKGTRLLPLTNYFQKTMIPIGAKRRPLLEYVVRLLVFHKIHDITMLAGYRAEEIENYFGNGSRFNARINYSLDPPNVSGSASALSKAVVDGKVGNFDDLIVYYGDVLSDLNLSDLIDFHDSSGADVTLVLAKGYRLPVGVAQVDKRGVVSSLIEKPTCDLSVTTGNMIISKKAIETLGKVVASSKRTQCDLMNDYVPRLLQRHMKVSGYYIKSFWYDIGTIEKYESLNTKTVEKHLSFLDEA